MMLFLTFFFQAHSIHADKNQWSIPKHVLKMSDIV